MAQAILMRTGGGGVKSDDVTAARAQVLKGYTALTSDSDDEPIEGTMENRGYHGPDSTECWLYPAEGGYVVRLEEGFYHKDESGYKPYVIAPTALVKNAVGYKPDKTLNDTNTCGEQGQVRMIDTAANNYSFNKQNTAYGIDFGRGTFYIDLPHGDAYYHRGDGHPHTCIDADKLGTAGADSVLQGQTATSRHGVKLEGTIPRWICTTGDVITALGSEFQVWDDVYAGRGRGIATRIPNGNYIQGANWVFISIPDLSSENLREGAKVGNMVGKMPDYRIGRPVFEFATFNTMYVGGVANKDFPEGRILRDRTYPGHPLSNFVKYIGLAYGGLCMDVQVNTQLNMGVDYAGFALDRALFMSPFRQVKITYRLDIRLKTGGFQRRAGVRVCASLISAANRTVGKGSVVREHFSPDRVGVTHDTSTGELILDTSNVNEDVFLLLYVNAFSDYNQSTVNGKVVFTKIELIN